MAIAEKNWSAFRFTTLYYHILYKDRGYSEACNFGKAINTLVPSDTKTVEEIKFDLEPNPGIRLKNVFGNYQLAFNEETPDRLILVFP